MRISIRKYRKRLAFTQEQLADKVEISREYIRRVERGKNGVSFQHLACRR